MPLKSSERQETEIRRLTNELIMEREISKKLSAVCESLGEVIDGLREELETEVERTSLSVIEIAHLREELQVLQDTFQHTHVALYEEHELLSKCKQCGLDLRNDIHIRIPRGSDHAPRRRRG